MGGSKVKRVLLVFLVTKAVMVQLVYQVWKVPLDQKVFQVQLDQRVNKVPMVHLAHLDHLVNCPYFHLSCSSREMLHMNLMHPEDSREHQKTVDVEVIDDKVMFQEKKGE